MQQRAWQILCNLYLRRSRPNLGNPVVDDLATYYFPAHADIPRIDVAFVGEPDLNFNPVGARGVGEIGITGVSAAVANAVYHSTGKRLRSLPPVQAKQLERKQAVSGNQNEIQQSSSTPLLKAPKPKTRSVNHKHMIASAIDRFLSRTQAIEEAREVFIPLAIERREKQTTEVKCELEEALHCLSDQEDSSTIGIKKVINAVQKLERILHSDLVYPLESSLFMGLFSLFDAFIGELLTAIYIKKPELFEKMNRSVSLADILQHTSFEELKASILQLEIENFRRKSYVEQFNELENTFGLKLKAFDNWSAFVECSQRRNLITHCDGIVSQQYIQVCKNEGYNFAESINVGDKLGLGNEYFVQSCELVMEVALKLGQTLWRKIFPSEIEEADKHLNALIYKHLRPETWCRAQTFGEFAVNQKNISNDLYQKIFTINYAISLKFGNKENEAVKLLKAVDWSATINDFKLAESVILGKYDDAANTMKKIGNKGEIIQESYYYIFPLFQDFRQSSQFLGAYKEIYGKDFTEELQKQADTIQAATPEEIKEQEQELWVLSREDSIVEQE